MSVSYTYEDARLESLSAAQKQLLRMGPRNVRLVQAKLREIAPYLGIATESLPKPSENGKTARSLKGSIGTPERRGQP